MRGNNHYKLTTSYIRDIICSNAFTHNFNSPYYYYLFLYIYKR